VLLFPAGVEAAAVKRRPRSLIDMGPCLWRWRESTRLFRAFATAPIGASSVEQLEDNLAALQNLSFSEAELKEVD
jgi:hypothetical protein